MAKLFANSGDPDQMLYSAASDLGLRYLPSIIFVSPDQNGLKVQNVIALLLNINNHRVVAILCKI